MKFFIFSVIVLMAVCFGFSIYFQKNQNQIVSEAYEGVGYLALVCLISALLPSPHVTKQHDN